MISCNLIGSTNAGQLFTISWLKELYFTHAKIGHTMQYCSLNDAITASLSGGERHLLK